MEGVLSMNHRIQTSLSALLLTLALGGCSAKSQSGTVKGSVTLDGQPLATGKILFAAADGVAPAAEATVTAGQYESIVPLGSKRVEIRAPKVTGQKKMYDTPDSPTVDTVVELLPAKYNVNSELTMTVEGAEQEQNFDLKSK
jgi:hypothetical protein